MRQARNDGERHRPRGWGREGRFGNGSKSKNEGRGTPKRSILSLSESLSASPQLSNLRPSAASRSQKNPARSAFLFAPAPHSFPGASPTGLSPSRLLTSTLRWSCQSSAVVQSGRASGERAHL